MNPTHWFNDLDTRSGWGGSARRPERPRWSPDGSELFYQNDGALWSVTVGRDPELRFSQPEKLFEYRGGAREAWDIMPDGETFVVVQSLPQSPRATTIHVVRNWVEELKRLVPTAR